jgi:peptidoglycan/xylan/chitin deacetylase (PgdA/CDA1 family)
VDEQQLAQLSDWAARLRRDGDSDELKAAGRALELATEEIARLKAQLSTNRRREPVDDWTKPGPEPERAAEEPAAGGPRVFDIEEDGEDPDWEPPRRGRARNGGGNGGGTAVLDRRRIRPARVVGTARVEPEPLAAADKARKPPRPPLREQLAELPRPGRGTLIAAAVVVALIGAGYLAIRLDSPALAASGPPADAKIGAVARQSLKFEVKANRRTLDNTSWVLDGQDIRSRVKRANGVATLNGRAIADGEHWLTVRADGRLPGARTERKWHFWVKTSPPTVRLDPKTLKAPVEQPMNFAGTVHEGDTVTVGGQRAKVEGDRFSVPLSEPPAGPVVVSVTDEYGNNSVSQVAVQIIPRSPRAKVRAVHVTSYAWADPTLRRGVMQLIDEGRINTVELDLKDEAGEIGFDANIPVGRQIGAVKDIYNLPQALDTLHRKGVMVVGRIVAFRDPLYATGAWNRGWKTQVIQTPDGQPYSGYGGFTNFASPAVRAYNVEIAREAAKAGIDDVLYDYVRRPDGPISTMVFPGLKGTPEKSVASFLGEARKALKPYGTFLGASVFGVAATRPTEVAQDIQEIGRNVDYVAPMVYPSHWANGEYNVSYPNGEPYQIVNRSLKDFRTQVKGTGARVVPWLQDFSLGVDYGPKEVAAQIKGARDDGIDEWLLWDPNVTYTGTGLPPAPKVPPKGAQPKTPIATAAPVKIHTAAQTAPTLQPNELGEVPVMMYHQIRADGGGDYDLTPAQFRAELKRLWREGYWPVRAEDLVKHQLDVPQGKTPVVMTFDDSTKEQLFLNADGSIKADTAIGIWLAFQRKHPKWPLAGTFFVNREPFAGVSEGPQLLRWLVAHGFEIANHTKDHIPLNTLSATEAQRQLALGQKIITDAIPGAKVTDMALPLGAWPNPKSLAWRGSWGGIDYRINGVFEVGAEPSQSPYSTKFDEHAIPRIRTTPPGVGDQEWGSSWWLDILEDHPERRYVSDGDPKTVSFPHSHEDDLAPRFEPDAKPY